MLYDVYIKLLSYFSQMLQSFVV